tara:strand:- start:29269 stop:30987 length:1719 start_codon:yes stop_codon:yes gene_type:complete
MTQWESLTVKELKEHLSMYDLPTSGNKKELVSRLQNISDKSRILDAEVLDELPKYSVIMLFDRVKRLPLSVLAVVGIMLLGSLGGAAIFADDMVEWIQGTPDYQLIEFDTNSARAYAESLIDLGDPNWEGRMSGTIYEHNTAEFIKSNFTTMGIPSTIEDFDVPMFVIDSEEPELSICNAGDIGETFPALACGATDVNADFINFQHRSDFVIQGYSGSAFIRYVDDIEVIDIGNGNDSSNWSSAGGSVVIVHVTSETESNTGLFQKAADNDVMGLILINERQNCDELVSNDCIPYFKSVSITSIDSIPIDLGFVMVSKSVGQVIIEEVVNGNGKLQFITNVENSGEATIKVPCGIIQGETDKLIIIGAHHDTVYNGPGAVDDTSGTATVLEMARQFGLIESSEGQPYYTIYFCTWGGEEEGLFGSTEWVDKHRNNLFDNLRLYINLDMNHVDIERNSGVTLFGNNAKDVDHINAITSKFKKSYPEISNQYNIDIRKIQDNEMPYNSDHAPFVYNIDEDETDGKEYGNALVCYGSGSSEYHTYLDNMDRFNEESLAISGIIYGSLVYYLAYGD